MSDWSAWELAPTISIGADAARAVPSYVAFGKNEFGAAVVGGEAHLFGVPSGIEDERDGTDAKGAKKRRI